MVRKLRKKSLYEVIGKGKLKPFSDKRLEKRTEQGYDSGSFEKEGSSLGRVTAGKWPTRPKMLHFLDNRLETSIPYTAVVAFALGCLLLFLVFFRLGQLYGQKTGEESDAAITKITKATKPQDAESFQKSEGNGVIYDRSELESRPAEEQQEIGSNRIVIKQYRKREDLEPAKKYFDEHGIETEIEQQDNVYFLVTKKDTYNNPGKEGTDGYIARQKIIEIGAGYEAPPGYERFVFKDPYGEKVR